MSARPEMAHNLSVNMPGGLPAAHAVRAQLPEDHANVFLSCAYGCGALFHPHTGRCFSIDGTAAPPECPRNAPRSAAGSTQQPGSIPITAVAGAAFAARLASVLEDAALSRSVGDRLGDPNLMSPPDSKDRLSVVATLDSLQESFCVRGLALVAQILQAVMGMNQQQRDALPPVRIADAIPGAVRGTGTGAPAAGADAANHGQPAPANIPMPIALAEAYKSLATALGCASIASHAAVESQTWKAHTVCVPDKDGNMRERQLFWKVHDDAVRTDLSVRAPGMLRSIGGSVDEALSAISDNTKVTLHGAEASVLRVAPRLGALRAARFDPRCGSLLAASWKELRDALVSAADAAKKTAGITSAGVMLPR